MIRLLDLPIYLSSKISLLRQLSIYMYVSIDIPKQFYQGYILPLIDYGLVIWGTISATNINRITKLQKRAALIILRADYTVSSATMFYELNWLSVNKRLKCNKDVFIYKTLYNLSPRCISDLLKPVSETHSRTLRLSVNGAFSCTKITVILVWQIVPLYCPKTFDFFPSFNTQLVVFKQFQV